VVLVVDQRAVADGRELTERGRSLVETIRSTSFSVRRRYAIRSATVIIFRSCLAQ
jgi:hypothetical protein